MDHIFGGSFGLIDQWEKCNHGCRRNGRGGGTLPHMEHIFSHYSLESAFHLGSGTETNGSFLGVKPNFRLVPSGHKSESGN